MVAACCYTHTHTVRVIPCATMVAEPREKDAGGDNVAVIGSEFKEGEMK